MTREDGAKRLFSTIKREFPDWMAHAKKHGWGGINTPLGLMHMDQALMYVRCKEYSLSSHSLKSAYDCWAREFRN